MKTKLFPGYWLKSLSTLMAETKLLMFQSQGVFKERQHLECARIVDAFQLHVNLYPVKTAVPSMFLKAVCAVGKCRLGAFCALALRDSRSLESEAPYAAGLRDMLKPCNIKQSWADSIAHEATEKNAIFPAHAALGGAPFW